MSRITTREAADLLGVSAETVRIYGKLGYLTPKTASGRIGRGQWQYWDRAEVEAFADNGAQGAAAYRESKGSRPPAKRKGRKVRA